MARWPDGHPRGKPDPVGVDVFQRYASRDRPARDAYMERARSPPGPSGVVRKLDSPYFPFPHLLSTQRARELKCSFAQHGANYRCHGRPGPVSMATCLHVPSLRSSS